MRPSFSVTLLSNTGDLPPVREQLREWLAEQPWTESQVAEIVLAVDEALTNVIRHGYSGRADQSIEFTAERFKDEGGEGAVICIRDYGRQVELSKICGRDLDEIRPGGLGVHLIKAMMNEAVYEHAPGGGLRLTMKKYLTHHARTDGT
jgi:anti-sigma regulatory factor (Ser/Thr protein kinase)